MDTALLITILLSIVAVQFAMILAVLGWMGNKLYIRLGEIVKTVSSLDTDLRGEIVVLDRRVTRVETHCNLPELRASGL